MDWVVTVDDDALSRALPLSLKRVKLVVESAGAAGLAAVMEDPTAFEPPQLETRSSDHSGRVAALGEENYPVALIDRVPPSLLRLSQRASRAWSRTPRLPSTEVAPRRPEPDERTLMKRTLARIALALGLMSATLLSTSLPASADSPMFLVSIDVAANGAATATVIDTLVPADQYLVVVTVTGAGTCNLTGPAVELADAGTGGFSNPASASVRGACGLYDGTAVYVASWTGLPGTSGQFPVYCTWVLGQQTCSVRSAKVVSPLP